MIQLPITATATVQEIFPSFIDIVILVLIISLLSRTQVRQSSKAEVAVLSYFLTLIRDILKVHNADEQLCSQFHDRV